MKNSKKNISAKNFHFVSKFVEACDNREAKGAVKFDVLSMGSFWRKKAHDLLFEVSLNKCLNGNIEACYNRYKKGLFNVV